MAKRTQKASEPTPYLSLREAAALLEMPYGWLLVLKDRRTFRTEKINGQVLVSLWEIDHLRAQPGIGR